MLCRAKHLTIARLYSGTPLIQSPMTQKKFGHINGVVILSGQAQISWLEGPIMTNTPYIAFAFLEQLLSLINNRNVDMAYSNWKNYLKFSFST